MKTFNPCISGCTVCPMRCVSAEFTCKRNKDKALAKMRSPCVHTV